MFSFSVVNSTNATATLRHIIEYHCDLVHCFLGFYIFLSILWFFLFCWWVFYVSRKYAQFLKCIHELMTFLTFLKALESAIFMLMIIKCPWQSNNVSAIRAINFTLFLLSSLHNTAFLIVIFLISKGYNIINDSSFAIKHKALKCLYIIVYLVIYCYFIANPPVEIALVILVKI